MSVSSLSAAVDSTDFRAKGQFYTEVNPFVHPAFAEWAQRAQLPRATILEPFAGKNDLIHFLKQQGWCEGNRYAAYDIAPACRTVKAQDTLTHFPAGYSVCVTNPPWLAKNSASLRGLFYPPQCHYDDLYKFALARCLKHCTYVAALVPESFIRANLFHERLLTVISLSTALFASTQHPVALALFVPEQTTEVQIYSGECKIGTLAELESHKPLPNPNVPVRFNDPNGNVGLIAVDNIHEPSIRFCDISELQDYQVRVHCRYITKLRVFDTPQIDAYNQCLAVVRKKTHDMVMTCYRGLRKDGFYRRRMDWNLARGIIAKASA